MRAIRGADYRASAAPIYQRHNLMNLDRIYKSLVDAYVLKSLNNGLPSVFEFREQRHHFTRESTMNLLVVPRVAAARSEQFIRVSGTRIYHGIRSSFRLSISYNAFNLKYKHCLRLREN